MPHYLKIDISFDNAQKISRLNTSGFNGLVIAWKERLEKKERTVKGDRCDPAKDAPDG